MSDTVKGQVEAVSIKGNRGSLKVGQDWYGAFSASASNINEDLKGKEVEFGFYESKGYKNIKGKVRVTSEPGQSSSDEPGKKYYKHGFFPIDPEDGQRSFIRKDSLTLSLEYNKSHGVGGGKEVSPYEIIETARIFEEFITGDLDVREVDAAIEAMNKTKGKSKE